ncbi:hypothetical protein K3495_g13238 [Podosphaera aphanis]|nr:hypothetical protein K3495_g13238 [Podosphaera aphanis]
MSSSNASNTIIHDNLEDFDSRNMGNVSMHVGGGVGGDSKILPNTDEEVRRFKESLKDESLAPRTIKKNVNEGYRSDRKPSPPTIQRPSLKIRMET